MRPPLEPLRRIGDHAVARRAPLAAALCALACVAGCPTSAPTTGSSPDTKDNGTFQTATAISLGDNDLTAFTGSISAGDGVDLYTLGTLATGDRILVDVQTTSGDLDPVAAIFDDRENIHAFNDDRKPDASDLNPLIDVFIRGAEGEYFLGIAPFPGSGSTGGYRVEISVTRGVGVPAIMPQTVFLNWAGGQNITVPNVGTFNLDAFDATDVGPYNGQTEALKDRVQEIIAERFDGFALTLLNSDDHARPTGEHSTVYFGGTSLQAFAISEQIDTHNADASDDAIIFTGSFRDSFAATPTFEQMATALGNTTAHEIGHLLGLVHTRECSSLMDTTCGNASLLVEQAFKLAPIDESVFPLGSQDALELLELTIGLVGF